MVPNSVHCERPPFLFCVPKDFAMATLRGFLLQKNSLLLLFIYNKSRISVETCSELTVLLEGRAPCCVEVRSLDKLSIYTDFLIRVKTFFVFLILSARSCPRDLALCSVYCTS